MPTSGSRRPTPSPRPPRRGGLTATTAGANPPFGTSRGAIVVAALACIAFASTTSYARDAANAVPADSTVTTTAALLDRIDVVGTSPLPGIGIDRDRLPANVQQIGGARLREVGAQNLPELMRSQVGSVNVVETQGNPHQLEVNFRGYTASPLLGQPQGLSVFLDGVRLNEAFGDVVNWDLLPRNALASLTVMPGANPVFGLNTLGGALVLTTRSGATHPGSEVELTLGSFGRRSLELSHGRALGKDTHLYVAGSTHREDGWRDHSPSELRQAFVRLDHKEGPLDLTLSLLGADNDLVGNGLLPASMLGADRSQAYTRPDRTLNRLGGLTLRSGWDLGSGRRLDGQLYSRRLKTRSVNGDLNDEWDGTSDATGVENRTASTQHSSGLALQWQGRTAHALWVLGASLDRATTDFEQTEAEGVLDDGRAVTALEDPQLNAAISGHSRTRSLYAATTLQVAPKLALTASGRVNHTRVTTVDEGRRQGLATQLDSDHVFRAFNPALGATWRITDRLTGYASAGRGNRAPSPIELGCSDPENPCVLPNALQADPPLRQVVTRSVEAGLRGELSPGWRWNAGVFRADNRDDILFVGNGRSAGYFANVGRTRRQGLELGLSGRSGPFDALLHYTRLDATYRSAACLVAASNSSAGTSAACPGEDEIEVRPGNRLPGVARQQFKLDLGWRPLPSWRLGANLQAQSGVYLRGNENNRHAPDGADFPSAGRSGGFALLNLRANRQLGRGWTLVGQIHNALNRRYATGGLLADNAFGADGQLRAPADWRHEAFLAPGAPRSYRLALQWQDEP